MNKLPGIQIKKRQSKAIIDSLLEGNIIFMKIFSYTAPLNSEQMLQIVMERFLASCW